LASCADFEDTANEAGSAKKPEEPDLRDRYVEGDYGAAGSEGGLPEPLGDKARESGRSVEADYGGAGTTPGRTAESEIGRYSEEDYGASGTVDPVRQPGPDTEPGPDTGTNKQE